MECFIKPSASQDVDRALDQHEYDTEHEAPTLCDSSSTVCGDPMTVDEAISLASSYKIPNDYALFPLFW